MVSISKGIVARRILNNYLRGKHIKRGKCVVCGKLKTDAHHSDYTKPLDVVWICRKYHEKLHHQNL